MHSRLKIVRIFDVKKLNIFWENLFFFFQMLRLAPFVALLALAFAANEKEDTTPGKYTVTEEAWFEVEVKDLDGPGQVNYTWKILA